MTILIPVMKPKIPGFLVVREYLQSMDESRIYSNRGPLLDQLESRYADFLGVEKSNLVICANATLALQGAVFLSPAEKFYVPSYTFPASLSSVINAGKELVLSDIAESDWTISTEHLYNSDKNGLIEVLPFGASFDFKRNATWEHVIIDAAASIGSGNFKFSEMNESWVAVFSLHATKTLGMGEGGIAVFGSTSAAEKFRSWINFGFFGNRSSSLPGINAKMSETSAAYGLASLDLWEEEESEWLIANQKAKKIALSMGFSSITSYYAGVNPYWIADFKSEKQASRVEDSLTQSGIGTRRWWGFGCHHMPAFSNFSSGQKFPVTDMVSRRTIGLPMYRDLSISDWHVLQNIFEKIL